MRVVSLPNHQGGVRNERTPAANCLLIRSLFTATYLHIEIIVDLGVSGLMTPLVDDPLSGPCARAGSGLHGYYISERVTPSSCFSICKQTFPPHIIHHCVLVNIVSVPQSSIVAKSASLVAYSELYLSCHIPHLVVVRLTETAPIQDSSRSHGAGFELRLSVSRSIDSRNVSRFQSDASFIGVFEEFARQRQRRTNPL